MKHRLKCRYCHQYYRHWEAHRTEHPTSVPRCKNCGLKLRVANGKPLFCVCYYQGDDRPKKFDYKRFVKDFIRKRTQKKTSTAIARSKGR